MKDNKIKLFENQGMKVRTILNDDGSISISAEDAAKGFGFIQIKNGKEYIRWERVNEYCKEFKFSPQVGKGDFIPESLFYLLGMKAENEKAKEFQLWLSTDVIPSIRKNGCYVNKTPTAMEILEQQFKVLKEHDKKLEEVSNKINNIENTMTIDYGKQEVIQRIAKERIVYILGGKESNAYKELSKKVFSKLWKDYKKYFHVPSYKDTLKKDFDKAVEYIEQWKPQKEIMYMILGANNQIGFDF